MTRELLPLDVGSYALYIIRKENVAASRKFRVTLEGGMQNVLIFALWRNHMRRAIFVGTIYVWHR